MESEDLSHQVDQGAKDPPLVNATEPSVKAPTEPPPTNADVGTNHATGSDDSSEDDSDDDNSVDQTKDLPDDNTKDDTVSAHLNEKSQPESVSTTTPNPVNESVQVTSVLGTELEPALDNQNVSSNDVNPQSHAHVIP